MIKLGQSQGQRWKLIKTKHVSAIRRGIKEGKEAAISCAKTDFNPYALMALSNLGKGLGNDYSEKAFNKTFFNEIRRQRVKASKNNG